jgi:hypothetical protein
MGISFAEQGTWRDRLQWLPRRVALRLVWWQLRVLGRLARLLWPAEANRGKRGRS